MMMRRLLMKRRRRSGGVLGKIRKGFFGVERRSALGVWRIIGIAFLIYIKLKYTAFRV